MTIFSLVQVPSQLCLCVHLVEDHDDSHSCTVIQYFEQCSCKWFTPDDIESHRNMPRRLDDSRVSVSKRPEVAKYHEQ